MGSDDEIQPMLDNEVPVGVREEEGRASANNALDKSTSPVQNDDDDDDEVEVHLTGCGATAFCDPSKLKFYFTSLLDS